MRFEGTLTSWNEGRGFGLIEPTLGGQDILVHVKALPSRMGRPALGQRFTFEVETNAQGRKRAVRVEGVRAAIKGYRHRPARWGAASVLAIPIFLAVYVAVATTWGVSAWVAIAYVVLSIVCLVAYTADKSAAVGGKRRLPEQSLLLLGLVGGWPGAIVARQLLRHKTIKKSFRSAFWGTVVVNVGVFVYIHSLLGGSLHG